MLGWFKKKRKKKDDSTPLPETDRIEEIPQPETEKEEIPKVQETEPAVEEDPGVVPESEAEPKQQEPEEILEEKKKEQAPAEPQAKSMFNRLSERLSKTRNSFVHRLDTLFLGKKEIDAQLLDDLEELLITADLGVTTAMELLDNARRRVKRKELSDPQSLKEVLKEDIKRFISESTKPAKMPESGPFVIMVIGVNGVGKTTTIGKIAHKFINSGRSVLLVAADTFRAAAVSQLQIWGERNNVKVVSRPEGSDPSSVVYDAMEVAKDYSVVLVDTAGRLHTQSNLMEELKKIKRVMGKKLPGAPHEVMLVIDATTGQNGISQARLFNAAVEVTGITLTKLDGTAKGGIVANISRDLKIPIRFIGIGEQLDDLRDFDPDEFIEALFQNKMTETDDPVV